MLVFPGLIQARTKKVLGRMEELKKIGWKQNVRIKHDSFEQCTNQLPKSCGPRGEFREVERTG